MKNAPYSRTGICFQSLEDRRLLAVYGNTWNDSRDLRISFPSDEVSIGDSRNNLHATLDQVAARQDWQELVLRAYQSWSLHADINIGLRNDFNHDFGVRGMTTHDPRFGEFRIGAFPQAGLLASSFPFQAVAGTNSGDILLNSNEHWTYHNWESGNGPNTSDQSENDRDLYTVLLHEVGNTLGLADTEDNWTVMFGYYDGPKGLLSDDDIHAIQTLYGARSDPYELIENGQIQSATLIPTPTGIDLSSEVIRTRGSLLNGDDVDHYKIVPASGFDTVTLRLRAQGVSLLKSRFQITDANGTVIQQTASQSVFENDNTITLTGISGHDQLYLRVIADEPSSVYSAGDYFIEVDYRDASMQAMDIVPGAYDDGPDTLFTGYAIADDEEGANDVAVEATNIPTVNTNDGVRHEIVSAVSSVADIDYFKVTAPQTIHGRLFINVASVASNGPGLQVAVMDDSGEAVGAFGRLHLDGTYSIEVSQPQAGKDYFIRVSVDPTSAVGVGNYVATAEFEAPARQMHHLANGVVSEKTDNFIRWTASETKLFRFDLNAQSTTLDHAVRMTVYDAHTREIRAVVVSQAGIQRHVLTWLQQGEYILRFTAISFNGSTVENIDYSVKADGLSDDMDQGGPDDDDDQDYQPYYQDYEYEYMNYYSGEGYDYEPYSTNYQYYDPNYQGP